MTLGYEIAGGLALSPSGIAFYAGQTFKMRFGLEAGVGATLTLFPGMKNLNDLDGVTYGASVSGAYLGQLRFGVHKSSGNWGGSVSVVLGGGGHISADLGVTTFLKVYFWDQTEKLISEGKDEGLLIAQIFGINPAHSANAITIIKAFYRKTVTEFVTASLVTLTKDLNSKNASIKSDVEYLQSYEKEPRIFKLINIVEIKSVKADLKKKRDAAQKDKQAIDILNNTKKTVVH